MTNYVELQCMSDFSFLEGASSAEELFAQAAMSGMRALAITDRNSVAGIVRAHQAAKETGVRLIVGCRLDLADGSVVLVYPKNRAAYARLCRLLTRGYRGSVKRVFSLQWADLAAYSEDMVGIFVSAQPDADLPRQLRRMRDCFGDEAHVSLTLFRQPNDAIRLHRIAEMAKQAGVKTVVTNNVLYHVPERRILQDVVTAIRHRCTIDALGFRRERTADRCLLPPEEMARRFKDYPAALARTERIADRCRFSLDELKYQYPKEACVSGLSPQQALEKMTWEGADRVYPEGVPLKVQATLARELILISKMEYAPYFLTVNTIVQFARSQDILCQGRGSAANSAVCYVLGITSIDPVHHELLFERFVSNERREPPDIDVDFEHERREIVIQWIYDTYGRDRAALCATISRYRAKGALRDVGKALGLPADMLKGLSATVWAWSNEGVTEKHAKELNLNLSDRRLRLALQIARQLIGFPRHFSQHPGGFVLTDDRLDDLVPIIPAAMDNRQIIMFDKDDIDALRFMKVDVLALGMLTCLKRSFDLLKESKGIDRTLASIPSEDRKTYRMIQRADTCGVFQIESRAQMNMLPRMKPKTFYDLVIEVAIVRPGPIQGDMVHPYLKRRDGREKPEYPSPQLKAVLGKTLGVPLFQEQAMRVAIECAGFTPGEADQFRRSMATFKFTGGVSAFHDKLIDGMVARGYERDFASRIFKQLEGFGSYGFPESHAASFALLAYASSWMKCHHPDVFCAALLNSQPMGFYAPAEIVIDAKEHGVRVLPVCVNESRWDCTLIDTGNGMRAVRLGLRMAKGLSNEAAAKIVAGRADIPYRSVTELWQRTELPVAALRCLVKADAFAPSVGLSRREAYWQVNALRDDPMPLFRAADVREGLIRPEIIEPMISLKPMTEGREVVEDYRSIGLSLKAHPVSFLRASLAERGMIACGAVNKGMDRAFVKTAGLVLMRQKPGSAKGVMFITLQDETGCNNLVVWPTLYERYRQIIFNAGMIGVEGWVQREGQVVHLIAKRLFDLSEDLASVGGLGFSIEHGRGDAYHYGSPDQRSLTPERLLKPRDILIPPLDLESIKIRTRDFR